MVSPSVTRARPVTRPPAIRRVGRISSRRSASVRVAVPRSTRPPSRRMAASSILPRSRAASMDAPCPATWKPTSSTGSPSAPARARAADSVPGMPRARPARRYEGIESNGRAHPSARRPMPPRSPLRRRSAFPSVTRAFRSNTFTARDPTLESSRRSIAEPSERASEGPRRSARTSPLNRAGGAER